MARTQSTIRHELRAHDVHELTQTVLQEHLTLAMEQRRYDAADIWDVLLAASVEGITIEMASDLLENAPSPNSVRAPLNELLEQRDDVRQWEETFHEMLVARLPKKLVCQRLPAAIDLIEIPYHGEYEEDEWVRRGKPKHGTSHFHVYATLYVVKRHKRYTLALTQVQRHEPMVEVVKRLVERVRQMGMKLKRLYLDRGFDNNGVVAYLKQQPFPSILPLTVRGAKGGTRRVLVGRKSHTTTYTRSSRVYGDQTLPVTVVCKYSKGRYRRQGLCRFAYVVIGQLALQPLQIYEEYRRRFAIETSYRMLHTVPGALWARTTATCARYRLLLVALAFLLLNLWSYVKWMHLYPPKRGPRQVFHHLLPLARWRLWFWEVIKLRLGFSIHFATVDYLIAVY